MGLLTWVLRTPASFPPSGTNNHSNTFAYDPTVNLCLTYDPNADTWQWDGTDWTNLTPGSPMPNLTNMAIVYDGANSEIVMFGGYDGIVRDYTYLWDWGTATWTLQAPATKPSARQSIYMTYDEARGEVVLFGGTTNTSASGALAQTWVWDGTTWTQKSPATSPSARLSGSMKYDRANGNVVLYGGRNISSIVLNETWTWDGTTWTQESPTLDPDGREFFDMCWDSCAGRVILFGGVVTPVGGGGSFVDNQTWAWDGTDWTNLTPTVGTPTESDGPGMAYYESRREATVWTGTKAGGVLNDQTWVLPCGFVPQIYRLVRPMSSRPL